MKEVLKDNRAQATTEYILMLFVAVSLFLIVYANFLKPVFKNVGNIISKSWDSLLVQGDLHRFPLGKH